MKLQLQTQSHISPIIREGTGVHCLLLQPLRTGKPQVLEMLRLRKYSTKENEIKKLLVSEALPLKSSTTLIQRRPAEEPNNNNRKETKRTTITASIINNRKEAKRTTSTTTISSNNRKQTKETTSVMRATTIS